MQESQTGTAMTIRFGLQGAAAERDSLDVTTKTPECIFGATFVAIGVGHLLAKHAKGIDSAVEGVWAINPLNEEKLPIWVAGYVNSAEAIMAVPFHNQQDRAFAQAHGLPSRQVIAERFVHEGNDHQKGAPVVPRTVVCMVVQHPTEDKLLIARPTGSEFWSPVMGGIDDGETPETTARRELLEESGYDDIEYLEVFDEILVSEFFAQHKKQNRIAYITTVLIRLRSLRAQAISKEEQAAVTLEWATPEVVTKRWVGAGAAQVRQVANGEARPLVHNGRLVNSGTYSGLLSQEARKQIVTDLAVADTV